MSCQYIKASHKRVKMDKKKREKSSNKQKAKVGTTCTMSAQKGVSLKYDMDKKKRKEK